MPPEAVTQQEKNMCHEAHKPVIPSDIKPTMKEDFALFVIIQQEGTCATKRTNQ